MRAAPPETPRIRPPALEGIEGVYAGSLSGSATGGGPGTMAPVQADLRLVGNQLTGRLVHPVCGPLPVALSLDSTGGVRGSLRLFEATGCTTNPASASGRLSAGNLTLDLHGLDVSYRGKLAPTGGQAEAPRPLPAPERRERTVVP